MSNYYFFPLIFCYGSTSSFGKSKFLYKIQLYDNVILAIYKLSQSASFKYGNIHLRRWQIGYPVIISSFSLNSFLFYLNWNLSRIHRSRKVIWYDWLSTQCLSFSRALSIMIMSLAGSFLAVLQNGDWEVVTLVIEFLTRVSEISY